MKLDEKTWATLKDQLRSAFTTDKFIADIGYVAWWIDGCHVGATPVGEWFSDRDGRQFIFQDGPYGLFDRIGESQTDECEKQVLSAIDSGRTEGVIPLDQSVVQWLLVEEAIYDRWASRSEASEDDGNSNDPMVSCRDAHSPVRSRFQDLPSTGTARMKGNEHGV